MEPARQIEGRGERLHDRLTQFEHLFIGLIGIERTAHASGEIQHSAAHPRFGFFESSGCDPLTQRHVKDIQKVHRCAEFEIRAASTGSRKLDGGIEDRITQKTGLNQVRLRNAKVRVDGLQFAIIEQSDLHGVIGRQLAIKQGVQFFCCFLVQVSAIVPKYLGMMPLFERGSDILESSIERHRRAAAQKQEPKGQPSRLLWPNHRSHLPRCPRVI